MTNAVIDRLERELATAREVGNYKTLHDLETATNAHVRVKDIGEVLLMCSNDYQGFADHPEVVAAARAALEKFGVGPASVRFICGTLTIHEELERKLANFLHTESAITYSSCWSANTGLFPGSRELATWSSPMHSITLASSTAAARLRRMPCATSTSTRI